MSAQPVIVVAGVIFDGATVLVTQRMRGAHLEGAWEFPGGKLEEDESPEEALARELREEIGVECEVGEVLDVTHWRYEQKRVLLIFYAARIRSGEVTDLGVAAHRWATLRELDGLSFPPADEKVLRRVREVLAARGLG
ncbi:MAG: (deoxy)nucleoside triphosphate pyrophosphohydrolase [Polyangiales bacterium]